VVGLYLLCLSATVYCTMHMADMDLMNVLCNFGTKLLLTGYVFNEMEVNFTYSCEHYSITCLSAF
jgi:hypothetical protein